MNLTIIVITDFANCVVVIADFAIPSQYRKVGKSDAKVFPFWKPKMAVVYPYIVPRNNNFIE